MRRRERSDCETLTIRGQNCALILMFILSEVAGVPGPQPRTAPAHSHWLCSLPRDKTVMKRDGKNTDHQRRPLARQPDPTVAPSLLPRLPFVSQHKFAPSSLSCWLCLFRHCRWRKISCTDSQWVSSHWQPPCLSYRTGCFKLGSLSSGAKCGPSELNDRAWHSLALHHLRLTEDFQHHEMSFITLRNTGCKRRI